MDNQGGPSNRFLLLATALLLSLGLVLLALLLTGVIYGGGF